MGLHHPGSNAAVVGIDEAVVMRPDLGRLLRVAFV